MRMMTAGMTFFLSSGLPFLTDARNKSPTEPAGYLLRRAPVLVHAIMYKFLAPVLSAQFMTEATGSEFVILILMPWRQDQDHKLAACCLSHELRRQHRSQKLVHDRVH